MQVLEGSALIPATDNALKNLINRNIKVLAERAKLTRITENGKQLHTEISTHYARHTAATQMARRGLTSEQIALQLGNSSEMVERVYTHATDSDIIAKLQPAAANTPAPQVATQTDVQAVQQTRTKIEAKKNIGVYDVTLQAHGTSEIDNYLINKELNSKLARLKELRESNAMSEGVFDYSLQYIAMRNEYRKLYNELIKKVLVKLHYPTQAIENKSSEELQNTLYLMRGDLLQYISKGQIKVLFNSTKDKTNEVDDLLNKIGVLADILEA